MPRRFCANLDDLLEGSDERRTGEKDRIAEILVNELSRFDGQRAGMVLTFGSAPNNALARGTRLSEQINKLLPDVLPEVFDERTVYRSFISVAAGPGDVGCVEIEIYWRLD